MFTDTTTPARRRPDCLRPDCRRHDCRRQGGLTLIELVMFLVIVGAALAGILGVLSYTNRNSADPQTTKQALAIAEGLLEEVELARFTFCDPSDTNAETATSAAGCSTPEKVGPESGNTRPYDNINDYVSQFSSGSLIAQTSFNSSSGVLVDAAGNAVYVSGGSNTLGNYSATLSIFGGQSLGGIAAYTNAGNAADTTVLRIVVTVTYGPNRSVTLEGYRTRYAPNAIP
jgi:MSHA pilin protein MshD